jgi:MFS transporter, DHA2 family, multidrug resistance protein
MPTPADAALLERMVHQQAVMQSTNDVFWLSGWLFVALMLLVWFARPPRHAPAGAKAGSGAH